MSVVPAKVPGLSNFKVEVPGTTVTVYMGVWDHTPSNWIYSLFDENDDLITTGDIDFGDMTVTDEQVARIAFLLECDYGPHHSEKPKPYKSTFNTGTDYGYPHGI